MQTAEEIQRIFGISIQTKESTGVKTLCIPKTSAEKVIEVLLIALAAINAGIALFEVILMFTGILATYIWPVPIVHLALIFIIILYFRGRPPVKMEIKEYTLILTKNLLNKTSAAEYSIDDIDYLQRSFTSGRGTVGCDVFAVLHNAKKILLVRKKIKNENEYNTLSNLFSAFLNIRFSE